MLVTLLQALAGLALLYFGGEWLVRGASALAARLGISPLAIGLTVVAFGTSAPELMVSLDAALAGSSDIAIGNVVGSNIANIALILGLAAVLHPIAVHRKVVKVDAPLMLVASCALLAILADGAASRLEGVGLLLGLAAYLAITFATARTAAPVVQDELAAVAPPPTIRPAQSLLLVAIGLAALVAGGHLLVTSAVALATLMGISEAVIGLTIVAIGTSLPELATSVVASLRGEGDIAIGNVVGSNIFNILGILGTTAVVQPMGQGAISQVDLWVMIGIAAALTLLLLARRRVGRVEGLVLLTSYVAYTGWLFVS